MKFQIKVGDLLAAVNDVSFTIDKKSTEGSGGILVRAFKTETEAAVLLYTTMHKADEQVSVADMDGLTKIYQSALAKLLA